MVPSAALSLSRYFRAGQPTRCPSATSPTECTSPPGTRTKPIGCGRCLRTQLLARRLGAMEAQIRGIADAPIWRMRTAARKSLIEYIRPRYARQVAIQGGSAREIAEAGEIFDINTLTLGFARRFATYKRPNLLLHDPDRADANSRQPPAPGATGHRRQGAPAGWRRTGDDSAVERVHP